VSSSDKGSGTSDDGSQLSEGTNNPDLDWDYSHAEPLEDIPAQNQEISIRTPNAIINIRPSARPGPSRGPHTSTPMLHRQYDRRKHRDVDEWVSQSSPITKRGANRYLDITEEEEETPPPPVVTRTGRISKPVVRFDPAAEALRQEELKLLSQALNRSKAEAKIRSKAEAKVEEQRRLAEREVRDERQPHPAWPFDQRADVSSEAYNQWEIEYLAKARDRLKDNQKAGKSVRVELGLVEDPVADPAQVEPTDPIPERDNPIPSTSKAAVRAPPARTSSKTTTTTSKRTSTIRIPSSRNPPSSKDTKSSKDVKSVKK
jgi:hypothetical protein